MYIYHVLVIYILIILDISSKLVPAMLLGLSHYPTEHRLQSQKDHTSALLSKGGRKYPETFSTLS